jgi:hypothetical protein
MWFAVVVVLTITGVFLAMYAFHALNCAAERMGLVLGEDPVDQEELARIALERESR